MTVGTRTRRGAPLAAATLLSLALTACGGGGGTVDAPEGSLVAKAQEEGEVVLYAGGHTRESVELLAAEFEEQYDIQVTYVRDDSGAIAQKVQAEMAGGGLNADVVSLTDTPTMIEWSADGITTGVDVPNRDQIIEGIDDPDAPHVPIAMVPLGIMYNGANLDASQAPSTWDDLAAGQSGRELVMSDPNASGTALQFVHMLTQLKGEDYFTRLADRGPTVVDSSLTLSQLVLTGEADVAAPALEPLVLRAAAEGEPLEIAYPEDGVPVFTSDIAALADAPHPNAAALLVRFQVSEEFQQTAVEEAGARSVIQGIAPPEGAADLSELKLLNPDYDVLSEKSEQLRARFTELFG